MTSQMYWSYQFRFIIIITIRQIVSYYARLQVGRKKLLSLEVRIFMATVTIDRPKNLSSSQSNISSTEQVHKSQFLTNLNINKIFPIPTHDVTNKNDDISNLFKIYHQNIRGLKGKTNKIMLSLLTEAPHLICLTEHHLKNYEIDVTPISNYKLGAKYCRKN